MSTKAASMMGAMFLNVWITLTKDPDNSITQPLAGSLGRSSWSSNVLPLPFPVLDAPNLSSFTSGGVANVGEEREEVGVGEIWSS
jgi:hypothetical protein